MIMTVELGRCCDTVALSHMHVECETIIDREKEGEAPLEEFMSGERKAQEMDFRDVFMCSAYHQEHYTGHGGNCTVCQDVALVVTHQHWPAVGINASLRTAEEVQYEKHKGFYQRYCKWMQCLRYPDLA